VFGTDGADGIGNLLGIDSVTGGHGGNEAVLDKYPLPDHLFLFLHRGAAAEGNGQRVSNAGSFNAHPAAAIRIRTDVNMNVNCPFDQFKSVRLFFLKNLFKDNGG